MKKKIKITEIREAFGKEVFDVVDVRTGEKYSGYLTMLTRVDCPSNHVRVKIGWDDILVEVHSILDNGTTKPNHIFYDMDTIRPDATPNNSGF